MIRAATAAAVAMALCGCTERYEGVTVTRTIGFGFYHQCLSEGVGLMICEQIQFNPKDCAMVVILPKTPGPGLRGALTKLSHDVRAWCPEKTETTP